MFTDTDIESKITKKNKSIGNTKSGEGLPGVCGVCHEKKHTRDLKGLGKRCAFHFLM